MVTWHEASPPSFDDWAEMREVYLSLLRPRRNVAAKMPAQNGRESKPGSSEWPNRGARLAPSAEYRTSRNDMYRNLVEEL